MNGLNDVFSSQMCDKTVWGVLFGCNLADYKNNRMTTLSTSTWLVLCILFATCLVPTHQQHGVTFFINFYDRAYAACDTIYGQLKTLKAAIGKGKPTFAQYIKLREMLVHTYAVDQEQLYVKKIRLGDTGLSPGQRLRCYIRENQISHYVYWTLETPIVTYLNMFDGTKMSISQEIDSVLHGAAPYNLNPDGNNATSPDFLRFSGIYKAELNAFTAMDTAVQAINKTMAGGPPTADQAAQLTTLQTQVAGNSTELQATIVLRSASPNLTETEKIVLAGMEGVNMQWVISLQTNITILLSQTNQTNPVVSSTPPVTAVPAPPVGGAMQGTPTVVSSSGNLQVQVVQRRKKSGPILKVLGLALVLLLLM